jgi:hypothetical protein
VLLVSVVMVALVNVDDLVFVVLDTVRLLI